MFKFLKRMFGKDAVDGSGSEPLVPARPAPTISKQADKNRSGVEVATLSLRAILEKLQPDIKALINQLPEPGVTIVLPVSTILKQIGAGAVKMSLASLIRQAPPGTFRKAQVEDKCMVDVPLGEIFKTLNLSRLARRADQRRYNVPEDAAGLFGSTAHTRSVPSPAPPAPVETGPVPPADAATPEEPAQDPAAHAEAMPAPEPQKILRMPGLPPAEVPLPANGNRHAVEAAPTPARALQREPQPSTARAEAGNQLVLPLVELAAGWPEGILSELSILSGDTRLVLPVFEVSAGLQKGKVSFPWSQIRGWLRPAFTGKTGIAEDYQLILPLKVVAPAFVAATGATRRQHSATVNESLPDFFGPTSGKCTTPASADTEPAASPVPIPATPLPIEVATPAPEASIAAEQEPAPEVQLSLDRETPAEVESPAQGASVAAEQEPAPEVQLSLVRETPVEVGSPAQEASVAAEQEPAPEVQLSLVREAPEEVVESPAPESEPAAVTEPASAPEPAGNTGELTLQTLFNQPEKDHWTPAELISHTCSLPGVAGAVIALEEGLVVAQQLPPGLAADTFAAFMPQIFGRLGRYTHEMQLGNADEIIFQTTSGPCHLARHGKVFFATVGRPGQPLPDGLRLIPAQLSHHNQ